MRRSHSRQLIAGILIVTGAVLMFLAPEAWIGGLVLLALGGVVELVGIALEHRAGATGRTHQ